MLIQLLYDSAPSPCVQQNIYFKYSEIRATRTASQLRQNKNENCNMPGPTFDLLYSMVVVLLIVRRDFEDAKLFFISESAKAT